MEYRAEGAQRFPTSYTLDALRRAMTAGDILESRALSFDSEKRLHFRLGEIEAIMPYEECADGVREGAVRDIALITRVGRPACFTVMEIDEQGAAPVALLSRTQAQQRCKAEYLDLLLPGDILPCRVTHLESFGAFCDIGCGVPALLPIDCMSVSRIQSPADRVHEGQDILCAVKSRDTEGRIVLTMKELLGTWLENAAAFAAGETVVGLVRSVEPYGVFVELAPNLAGLAEAAPGLDCGQLVSVYIKSIIPEKNENQAGGAACYAGRDLRLSAGIPPARRTYRAVDILRAGRGPRDRNDIRWLKALPRSAASLPRRCFSSPYPPSFALLFGPGAV